MFVSTKTMSKLSISRYRRTVVVTSLFLVKIKSASENTRDKEMPSFSDGRFSLSQHYLYMSSTYPLPCTKRRGAAVLRPPLVAWHGIQLLMRGRGKRKLPKSKRPKDAA